MSLFACGRSLQGKWYPTHTPIITIVFRFCLSTLKGHDEWIRDVTISSDGSLIASCSNDKVSTYIARLLPELLLIRAFVYGVARAWNA